MFLYIGVSKFVYDNLITFCQGRTGRFAGGFRHTVPWGIEVPPTIRDREEYLERNMPRVRAVVEAASKGLAQEEVDFCRAELPLCYIPAPFALEYSEEALVTKLFKQRMWEKGVKSRMAFDVVNDMWECCLALDREKFEFLYDLHGPHIDSWEEAMRRLRDKETDLAELLGAVKAADGTAVVDGSLRVYDALCSYMSGR